MVYDFKISEVKDNDFKFSYPINGSLVLNHNNELYLEEVSKENSRIICFGYCFDIKSPEINVEETLYTLLESTDIEEALKYLNGHFIILYIRDHSITLYTDASSLTPVYFSKSLKIVCNRLHENENFTVLNPNFKVNLMTFDFERFNSLKDYKDIETDKLKDNFILLIQNQYKYFKDKSLNVNFQADNYHKALFAILSPALTDQNIIIKKIDSKEYNKIFGEIFSKEFRMNYYEIQEGENEYPLTEGINFFARNNLTNFKAIYIKENNKLADPHILDMYRVNDNDKETFNYEMNLIDNYHQSNLSYSEYFLLYEPLNAREILNIFIELKKRENLNTNIFTVEQLKPSLNFYNFTSGETLRDLNLILKQEINELKSNSISSQNQKFLLDVKLSNFKVSQNLNGKIKDKEILVYPAKQKIKKGTEYNIKYTTHDKSLIFIEGFYKNENNARRIIVTVNNEQYNIYDFYNGRYFFCDGEMDITFNYTQDYDQLSWQKAGTIRVKRVD